MNVPQISTLLKCPFVALGLEVAPQSLSKGKFGNPQVQVGVKFADMAAKWSVVLAGSKDAELTCPPEPSELT